jgi:hypothetical protein
VVSAKDGAHPPGRGGHQETPTRPWLYYPTNTKKVAALALYFGNTILSRLCALLTWTGGENLPIEDPSDKCSNSAPTRYSNPVTTASLSKGAGGCYPEASKRMLLSVSKGTAA